MGKLTIPLLAVDGGGTKCLVVLMDKDGNVLGQGKAGSCNYQGVGEQMVIRELVLGIREALLDLNKGTDHLTQQLEIEVECAVFGLAGLDTEYDRGIIIELVKKALVQLHINVLHLVVKNDGLAALLGATAGKPGILVVAGTGSIVFGINQQGEMGRAGGWGHRVGDEGSGYWIGKQAVMAILKASDGRGEETRLGEWVFPHLGLNLAEELFNWIYSSDYSVEKLGELSRLVSLAAAEGDREAAHILTAASHELFLAVRAVIHQLKLQDKPFIMILQGGVLQNENLVREKLITKLREYAPLAELHTAQGDPINGVTAIGLAYLNSSKQD